MRASIKLIAGNNIRISIMYTENDVQVLSVIGFWVQPWRNYC